MNWDAVITIGILVFIVLLVYTKLQKQTLKDTIIKIKEMIGVIFTSGKGVENE